MYVKLVVGYAIVFVLLVAYLGYLHRELATLHDRLEDVNR